MHKIPSSGRRAPRRSTALQEVDPALRIPQNFIPDSKLRLFLATLFSPRFSKGELTCYWIVIEALRYYIKRQQLYDVKNTVIIICNPILEEVLNVKAFHLREMKHLISKHFSGDPPPALARLWNRSLSIAGKDDAETGTESSEDFKKKLFIIKPPLRRVFETMKGFPKKSVAVPFQVASALLSKYILSRQKDFLDERNIQVAMVRGDPLGEAFACSAFHRCQVGEFLMKQLIEI